MKLTAAQLHTLAGVAKRGFHSVEFERLEILRGPGQSVAIMPEGYRAIRIYVLPDGELSADGRTA